MRSIIRIKRNTVQTFFRVAPGFKGCMFVTKLKKVVATKQEISGTDSQWFKVYYAR